MEAKDVSNPPPFIPNAFPNTFQPNNNAALPAPTTTIAITTLGPASPEDMEQREILRVDLGRHLVELPSQIDIMQVSTREVTLLPHQPTNFPTTRLFCLV